MDLVDSLLPTSELAPDDVAVAAVLARCRRTTLRAYRQDMLSFLTWCAARDLTPLRVSRPHLELYLRCTGPLRRLRQSRRSPPAASFLHATTARRS